HQKSGLVRLPPLGHGCQVGAIGFDQIRIGADPTSYFLNRFGTFEGHDARKRHHESEVEDAARKRHVFAETVDDPSYIAGVLRLEYFERFTGSVARMNDHRLLQLSRQPDVATKHS